MIGDILHDVEAGHAPGVARCSCSTGMRRSGGWLPIAGPRRGPDPPRRRLA
ncbi:MAG: hypothetical protein U0531_09180 [Dehalococcoidia bacterium]